MKTKRTHNLSTEMYHCTRKRSRSAGLTLLFILFVLVISACTPPAPTTEMANTPTPEGPGATNIPSPTPSLQPPKTLTICTAQEPASLYLYDGNQSTSKQTILAAIYDGPIDSFGADRVPVILTDLPSLENGGMSLVPTAVRAGQEVVDASGELHVLQQGVFVRPSGCYETACAVAWDGAAELSMDVMRLRFTLLDGLRWSDGMPLTAADSLFSYQLAVDPLTPVSKWASDRTASYQAINELDLEWQGLPGFTSLAVDRFFWSPLPQHLLDGIQAVELLSSKIANQQPVGWGAWQIRDWQAGQALHMDRNPHYFRALENLPYFDQLTVRFISDPDLALAELQNGSCDLLDSSYDLQGRLDELQALAQSGTANYFTDIKGTWQGLTFGIQPASYDNGYTPLYGDRPDFFSDGRVRQAFAYCIDRQRIVDEVLGGNSAIPAGLLPDLPAGIQDYQYDPLVGKALLEAAGWRDVDNDPSTPLTSWQVPNLSMGIPFSITLHTGPASFDQQAARIITASLAECGVQVEHMTLPLEELFAPGPEGVLFGRAFDLALFSWAAQGVELCPVYQSASIPTDQNYWIGSNLGGYQNQAYDWACHDALLAHASSQPYLAELNAIFHEELPAIPLVYTPYLVALRSGLALPGQENPSSTLDWLEILQPAVGGN